MSAIMYKPTEGYGMRSERIWTNLSHLRYEEQQTDWIFPQTKTIAYNTRELFLRKDL